jgi:hypothetical protein
MGHAVQALLNVLQPPYSWVLLLVMALPYWVLFVGVFLGRWQIAGEHEWIPLALPDPPLRKAKRDLSRYAAVLTALWLLILVFKIQQQYFTSHPLLHTGLGVFDLSLGLFSLASWAGMLMLKAQESI